MKVEYKKSFLKDLKKLKNKILKKSILKCIEEVESSSNIRQITNLKKLTGYENHFRVKIGDYRIGLKLENDVMYFVVFNHRKDIYRGFP